MIIEKGKSNLLIQDATAFLNINNLNDIFKHKDVIEKNIVEDKINVLLIIWTGQDNAQTNDQKVELYKWLKSLIVLTIGVINNYCSGDLLELFMTCDIRLGGDNLSIEFPDDESVFIFNFEERCQLLMGNERNIDGYKSLLKTTLHSKEIYKIGLINKIIDMDDMLSEVRKYISKLLKNKNMNQIKSILKCFKHYTHLGLNHNRELLLEQESKQFCELIVKEYYKNEDMR
ncbi:MAG: hypothetical protein KAX49_11280 [Halanaerobiales bacterium]|nr:hypothetical protein [Halanaerobiales bacterium]